MVLGGVKLDNTLLTCDQGNFNQMIAWSRNGTLVTVLRDTCTTTLLPVSPGVKDEETTFSEMLSNYDK